MVQYNFKKITKVPTGKDFVDIVLSRTQRQTPTVVHKGYAINRIRQFYMRKVKFTQTNFHEKLSTIIEEFPRLDDIHPFYGDLLHVLYNKDHYKLALGQINTARNLISKIAKDYVKLLKYGDSLYRCKALKGVIAVKNAACERLLDQRVEVKMKSKKINDCLNRFHVAVPKPRDQKERPACIPQAVLEAKAKEAEKEKKKLERDLEEENGGAGVYSASLKKHYLLANDEWKEDNMPEILDGHNVYDFVDPDILQRLEELEKEEGLLQEQDEDEVDMDVEDLTPQQQKELAEIRRKKSVLIREHRIKKSTAESRPIVPRKFDKDKKFTSVRMGRQLSSLGLDPSKAIERVRSKSRGRKRERSTDHGGDDMNVDDDGSNKKMRLRSLSRPRSRSSSRPPTDVVIPGEGYKDSAQKIQAFKMGKKSVYKRNKDARKGEGDRVIPNLKPKHLYSGKRSNGKTTRR
ncbi:putative NOG1 helical domain-containing protein [Helianthus debilis subsp. tardiflorus]